MERFFGTDICVWSIVLGSKLECGVVCWDRNLSVEHRVGPIFARGAVLWDRYFSVEHSVGTFIRVWSGLLGSIIECGSYCWDHY